MDSLQLPASIRVAQVVGLFSGSILTGMIGAFSYIMIPCIVASNTSASPGTMARQWKMAFDIGVSTAPPIAIATSSSFAYLAWTADRRGEATPSYLYAAAACLTPAIVPFTLTAMAPVNEPLFGLAAAAAKDGAIDANEVRGLLAKWKNLNYVRALIVGSGALLAHIATQLWTA